MYSTGQELIDAVRVDTSEKTDDYVTDEEILNWINDFIDLYLSPMAGVIDKEIGFGTQDVVVDRNVDVLDLTGTRSGQTALEPTYIKAVYYNNPDSDEGRALTQQDYDQIRGYAFENSDSSKPLYYAVSMGVVYAVPMIDFTSHPNARYYIYYEGTIENITASTSLDVFGLPSLYWTTAKKYAVGELYRKHKEIRLAREHERRVKHGIDQMLKRKAREGTKDIPKEMRHTVGKSSRAKPSEVPDSLKDIVR